MEHETWKDSFTVTKEMMEDSKLLDLNRTGAKGFIDAYALTREKYGASILVGAVNGTSTTLRGMKFSLQHIHLLLEMLMFNLTNSVTNLVKML